MPVLLSIEGKTITVSFAQITKVQSTEIVSRKTLLVPWGIQSLLVLTSFCKSSHGGAQLRVSDPLLLVAVPVHGTMYTCRSEDHEEGATGARHDLDYHCGLYLGEMASRTKCSHYFSVLA